MRPTRTLSRPLKRSSRSADGVTIVLPLANAAAMMPRKSLEETRDFFGRGFEWSYWQAEMHRDALTLRGHLDRVSDVTVSLDGRWIASASVYSASAPA